jgi:hypothetical protein
MPGSQISYPETIAFPVHGAHFFGATDAILSPTLLGASLGIVDSFKPAKRILAEHMMFGWRQALNAPATGKAFRLRAIEI